MVPGMDLPDAIAHIFSEPGAENHAIRAGCAGLQGGGEDVRADRAG